jgi:phosphotransferase system enzyme I (PtsI)
MEIYKGTSTFSGIAIGKIRYYQREEYQIHQYLVNNVKKEIADFHAAKDAVIRQLKHLYEVNRSTHREEAEVFQAQVKILETGSFQRAVESMISTEKVNAAYAVMTTRNELTQTFSKLEDSAVRERIENVSVVSKYLLSVLGGSTSKIDLGSEPVILAAENLTPAEIMEMDKEKLLAVVIAQASEVSHTAILAKTIGIPVILGVLPTPDWDQAMGIVDGYTGNVYLDPDSETVMEYEVRRKTAIEEREEFLKLKNEKDVTLDGKEIGLYANIGKPEDLKSVLFYGAAGIGLLRSEYQYLGRENYPGENELFDAYKEVAQTMGERWTVIRTVDLGADKLEQYLEIPEEVNPIMGNRGIRLCLDRRIMFKDQLRAIYRASAFGNIAVMYPMISSESEVDAIEEIVEEVKDGLRKKGIAFGNVRTGIMIETPASVMISEELAKRADFLSIGTNDLTQYTLAMDRENPLLRDKYDDHHPAILRMIRMAVEAGHRQNCKVYICGELAADTELTQVFLRMGVDGLSVVPAYILPVRKKLREIDLSRD